MSSKLQDLTNGSSIATTDLLYAVENPGTTPVDRKVTVATLKTGLGLSGTNTGDQTSTAGLSNTTDKNLVTDAQLVVIGNTSGTNTGDQNLSGLMVKTSNLSDVASASTARTNLGLGTLATQSGTFSGTSSGTNTGDQTLPTDATIATTDVTTNNVSTSKHGWAPKAPNDATKYLDGTGSYSVPAGSSSGDMVLASVQTVTGAKTFNAGKLLDKGSQVFNVKSYGALGDGTTDDTTNIQSAITAALVSGGTVFFPQGTYKISSALTVAITSAINASITIRGVGSSYDGGLGSVINQTSGSANAFTISNNAVLSSFRMSDLSIKTTGNSTGYGIYLSQSSFTPFEQCNFENITISGYGNYGFRANSLIVATLTNISCVGNTNGFFLDGASAGACTSVSLINCYANANTTYGFRIDSSSYISLVSCAADDNGTANYYIVSCGAISLLACGAEFGATQPSAAFYEINGSNQVGLYNCYIYAMGTSKKGVWATGTSTGITVIGLQLSNATGGTGITVDAGSVLTNIDSDLTGASTAVTNSGTYSAWTSGTVQASYKSSDGTAGLTQGSTSVTGKSITVKNGLVTAFA